MAKSEDYKLGYARGYNAGANGKWPDHRPPFPPHNLVRMLMQAARSMRDDIDCYLSTLPDDDEAERMLGCGIEEVDIICESINEWLTDPDKYHADADRLARLEEAFSKARQDRLGPPELWR